MNARSLSRAPLLRNVLRRPAVQRFVATILRGRPLRERLRFVARELGGSKSLATYRLRGSGIHVCLRHSTPDLYTLDQVFYQRLFELPDQISAELERCGARLRVVDLGANIGLFGVYVLGLFPHATIVAFEPDPANARVLSRCIAENDRTESWQLVEACAATFDGNVSFRPGEFGISHIAQAEDDGVIQVPAIDVFEILRDAHLVKVDIEGAEWELLADARLRDVSAPAIHLEYHFRACPEADARALATRLLQDAGYACEPLIHTDDGNGILWAWR